MVDAEGQITFAQLKSAFPNVSEMTLHTDLKHLNESGRIVRVHGGARSAEIVAGAEDFFPSGFNGIESKSKQSLKRPLPCFKRITGFNPSSGFCCENEGDCLLKQAVIRQSDTIVVLMDSKKYGQYNTYSICQCDVVRYGPC